MNRISFFILTVLAAASLFGCVSSSSDFDRWSGFLIFDRSICDLIVSDPPEKDPHQSITYEVNISDDSNVTVVDTDNNVYNGQVSGDAFNVFPDENSDPSTFASAIRFQGFSDGNATVTASFVRNAPHGCSHLFTGSFLKE